MRLSFLGTGAATSQTRFSVATVVDGCVLIDAGAPVVPLMSRLGIDSGDIRTVLLTHFHGDHLLGLPTLLVQRSTGGGAPLTIVGPEGVEACVERLCTVAWGANWKALGRGLELEFVPVHAGSHLRVDHLSVEVVNMEHDPGIICATPSVGYRLDGGSLRVGFSGDAAPGQWVDDLVDGCDVALVECTAPDPGPTHLSHDYVRDLVRRHDSARLFLHHFATAPPDIEGATVAEELADVEL